MKSLYWHVLIKSSKMGNKRRRHFLLKKREKNRFLNIIKANIITRISLCRLRSSIFEAPVDSTWGGRLDGPAVSLAAGSNVQDVADHPVVFPLQGGVDLVELAGLDHLYLGHDVVPAAEVHALLTRNKRKDLRWLYGRFGVFVSTKTTKRWKM
jgi:hypothetical protein